MSHIANCMRRTLDKTDSVYIMEETLAISPTVRLLLVSLLALKSHVKLNFSIADKRCKDGAVSKRECRVLCSQPCQIQSLATSTEDASVTVESKSVIGPNDGPLCRSLANGIERPICQCSKECCGLESRRRLTLQQAEDQRSRTRQPAETGDGISLISRLP